MWTGRPRRLPGFDYIGHHRYFLTFCTFERRRCFIEADVVERALSQILRAARQTQFAVIAYCFMPDHLHMLVNGLTSHSNARLFIKLAKQYAGFEFKQRGGQPLWQRYAYEHVVRSDAQSIGIARYVMENPIRAGLVDRPEAYPFSGCPEYSWSALMDAIATRPERWA